MKKNTYDKNKELEVKIIIKQQEVRDKLIKRVEREKQSYIARQIGVPKQVLSAFKLGKKDLWESSLIALNDYLDNSN